MISLSKFDWRQIKLIEKKLLLFENKIIDLFMLHAELEAISCALENVSESWVDEFQSKVSFLEMIDDCIKDGSISRWQENYEEDLDKTVVSLKQMVSSLLEDYLRTPDSKISEIAIEGDSTWLICPNCFDAWESTSFDAMVFCPKCEHVCHNPRFKRNFS